MNFIEVERLALLSKKGDMQAKEELAEQFRPFIFNLAKRSYVHGFEFEDIVNECYNSLFNCLNKYNPDKHRFVAYATISIKNSVGLLIRYANKRNKTEGADALTYSDKLEHVLSYDMELVEEILKRTSNLKLKNAYEKLKDNEKDLVNYVYVRNHTLKQYSSYRNLSYSKVVNMKNRVIKDLRLMLNDSRSIGV